MLRGSRKSSIKKGWWAGSTDVQVDGRQAIVKRYEGTDKDIKRVSLTALLSHRVHWHSLRNGCEMSGYCKISSMCLGFRMIVIADMVLSHPNLPQMIGYSNDETPTPFILLANGEISQRLSRAYLAVCLRCYTSASTTAPSYGPWLHKKCIFGIVRQFNSPLCEWL